MGRGGWTRPDRRGWRRGDERERLAFGLRPRRRQFPCASLHRVGRPRQGGRIGCLTRHTNLLRQIVRNIGPFALGGIDDATGITEERSPRLLTIEEVKSLPDHDPEQRMARRRSATANGYRIVPAK